MFILDATTKKLEIKLGGAVATAQCPFVSSYVDVTTSTYAPGSSDGVTNNTTAVIVVDVPGASTQRQVKLLTVRNSDSAPVTLTLQYNDNGTIRIIAVVTLPIGATFLYVDGLGLQIIDANGNLLTATAVSAHKANHVSGGSDAFASTDVLESADKRMRETGGPTILTWGDVADTQFLQRSGTAVIGVAGIIAPSLRIVTNSLFK